MNTPVPVTEPEVAAPATGAAVLCVDDEPNILSALRRLFRGTPHRVETANSGAEALEKLAAGSFDIVISDMRMPEMDGAALLEQVRLRWPQTVRIMLTGFADMPSTVAAINRGEIYRYLAKPWNEGELLHTVDQALERKRLREERDRLLDVTRQQNEALTQLNADLETRVELRTQELAQANVRLQRYWLTSIKIFTSLMELRGGVLAGHARRVADVARRIALQMGLSGAEAQDVFLAGLLHDVGKLSLPDAVLAKPLKDMNAADLVHYRKHPALGEQALMPLENLHAAAQFVRSHHERHDGRGFPDGLHGEQIPLGARILALANDLDNLLQGRHGNAPLAPHEARQRVQELRELRYDPAVVDAWLAIDNSPAQPQDCVVTVGELLPGDVLAQDWVNADGLLLLAADRELDARLIQQIRLYQAKEPVLIRLHIRNRQESSDAPRHAG